jgi:WD40 repeat protein
MLGLGIQQSHPALPWSSFWSLFLEVSDAPFHSQSFSPQLTHEIDSLHPTLDVLVTAGRDATARVWDMRTKAQAMILTGHTATVADVKCQDSDPQVITGSMDTTIRYGHFIFRAFTHLTAVGSDYGILPPGKP